MEQTPGHVFYQKQIAALETNNLDALMDQYTDDAILVSFDVTVRGREEIRAHMARYLAHLGFIKLRSTDKFTEIEDAIFFEASVTTQLGDARLYDVFVLREGKAARHFTGVLP